MQYKTTFKTIPLADIVECPYNPRVAIERDTPEYDALRRSLENVLSPLEPAWNEAMLKQAGFCKVEMFWRCLNFCGWIAVK